ncbi:histidinol-phosphatase HisJ family protein [Serpentinicella sp. ANB-PHB4]|uniref:histidinol-phosphatase HisJ family protein n=1 Tax=Serpentinicella sp. ANB-PHB4 TaxID=3074076 RepID=UPI002861515D|nr:histidinol-phosphatase HisJ family protein [Serpentinicella sp. ANB-PHB4]MDR5657936.1 histidinol-phosphatase HisJ family protein [Serpentinicella sp. ANB-PHB4]
MFDYHMHSQFSPDAYMTMKEAIEQAIHLGLSEICFTDHLDYVFDGHNDIKFSFSEYFQGIEHYQDLYKNKIIIKQGVEVGLQPHILNQCEEDILSSPFDFVIASVHSVEKNDLYSGNFFDSKTQKQAYLKYFEEMLYVIKHFKAYNVFGHLDMIKRYGGFDVILPLEEYKEITTTILEEIISNDKGIELNTSGIRYKLGDYHPSLDIIKHYYDLGGRMITLGSDAHVAKDIAFDFKRALNCLKDIGFKYIATFDKMEPKFHEIDKL